MAIYRGPLPQDGYTIILNRWLRDPRTTYKAKGILSAIASHKADYPLTVAQLVNESKDGEDAVYSGLRELVDAGYLRMNRARREDGTLGETDFHLNAEMATPGNSRPGPDQAEQPNSDPGDTRPGFSRPGESRRGETRPGKSGTKKTTGLEDELQEDPPTPASGGPTPTATNPEPQNPDRCRHHLTSCRTCGTNPRARARKARQAATTKPKWCGKCNFRTRLTDTVPAARCPDCHPANAAPMEEAS